MEESSSSSSYKRAKAPGNINNKEVGGCLVDGCDADLRECREYHRRHKVCEAHSKTPVVTIAGRHQRFCQQCSRFHSLGEFDEGKRSCRKRLDGHNRRRRKLPQPPVNQHHPGGLLLFSSTHQQQQQQQYGAGGGGGGGGGRLLSFSSPSQTLPEMMVHYNLMNYHQNPFNHQHQQMEEFLLPCQNAAADPALSLLSPTPPREFGNLGMEHASSSSFQFCSDQGSSTAPPHHTLTFTFD